MNLFIKTPKLVCAERFQAFLYTHCPILLERFVPTPWCWSGRWQTIIRLFVNFSPAVTFRNEIIRTGDGGQLSLDWLDNTGSTNYPQSSSRPTVLILPGMTGSIQKGYIKHMVQQATCHGYRCVVMNNRGFGGAELLTPVTFSAARTEDVETTINFIKELYPQAPLVGAGVSLGGMLLLNYLARKGPESKMIAGFTLSVIWDMIESCKSLEQPTNKFLFNRQITGVLCQIVDRNKKMLERVINVDNVLKARTIREFDERFTSIIFGYNSCDDYYQDASPYHKLPQISVPVLCLNAADDPFSPKHAFPEVLAQHSPNVALLITSHGGHVGFLEGLFPHGESYMHRVFGKFIRAAFEHQKELKEACSNTDQF